MATIVRCWTMMIVIGAITGCRDEMSLRPPLGRQIIHVLNRHYVSRDDFAADLRSSGESIADDEIDSRYEVFLDEIEALQAEQVELLRELIREHNLTAVYVEGLTAENIDAYRELAAAIRRFEASNSTGDSPIDLLLLEQRRLDLLELGAAGRLLISGELKDVLPCEDAEAFQLANPVREDGTVEYDQAAIERREDAIVRSLLSGGRVAVVILGSDHDLGDYLKRRSSEAVRYMRVPSEK